MGSFKDKLDGLQDQLNSTELTAADDGRAENSPEQPSAEEFQQAAESESSGADQQTTDTTTTSEGHS